MGTLGTWQVLAVAGLSPGGALVCRLHLDCALAGEWGGGEGNAVPGDEQGAGRT